MGVIGMTLEDEDEVIGMQLSCQGEYLLFVSENGYGKRTAVSEFKIQNRGGKGIKGMQKLADDYVEELRKKLNGYLEGNDGIQIT